MRTWLQGSRRGGQVAYAYDEEMHADLPPADPEEHLLRETGKVAKTQEDLDKAHQDKAERTQAMSELEEELRVERTKNFKLETDSKRLSDAFAEEKQSHLVTRSTLVQQNGLREADEAELRTVKVLHSRDHQKLVAVTADCDLFRKIVEQRDHDSLFLHGKYPQAVLEIQANIRQAMKGAVRTWVHGMPDDDPGLNVPGVLAQVFLQCHALVRRQYLGYNAFFLGKPTVEGAQGDTMEEGTANFMLKHLRRHHRTLYPVAPRSGLERACRGVVEEMALMLRRNPTVDVATIVEYLIGTGVQEVIKIYLPIMVSVTLHPPLAFAHDCGRIDDFNKKIHANSIDGDAVCAGEKCVVIFPALIGKQDDCEGLHPIGDKYILPVPDKSGVR